MSECPFTKADFPEPGERQTGSFYSYQGHSIRFYAEISSRLVLGFRHLCFISTGVCFKFDQTLNCPRSLISVLSLFSYSLLLDCYVMFS